MRDMQINNATGFMLVGIAVLVIASLVMNAVMLSRLEGRAEQRTGDLASLQGTEQQLVGEEGTLGAQLGDGTGPGVSREFTRVQITGAPPRTRNVKGTAQLTLFVNELGATSVQSSANLEGKGLTKRRLYEIWLEPDENDQGGKAILLQTGGVKEDCDDNEENCTYTLKLQRRLTEVPNVTTLKGFTISVREQLSGPASSDLQPASSNLPPAVATGLVTNVTSTTPN